MSKKDGVIFSTGKKTFLRPLDKSDIDRCYRWINDPEIRKFLASSKSRSKDDVQKFIENSADGKNYVFTICDKESGNHMGNMGLHDICHVNGRATTGALIGEKKFHGKGHGSDAKMLLLHHAFFDLNLQKVKSRVLANNPRSKAYLEKTGYREEGLLRDEIFNGGEYVGIYQMAIFLGDFIPLWEKYAKDLW